MNPSMNSFWSQIEHGDCLKLSASIQSGLSTSGRFGITFPRFHKKQISSNERTRGNGRHLRALSEERFIVLHFCFHPTHLLLRIIWTLSACMHSSPFLVFENSKLFKSRINLVPRRMSFYILKHFIFRKFVELNTSQFDCVVLQPEKGNMGNCCDSHMERLKVEIKKNFIGRYCCLSLPQRECFVRITFVDRSLSLQKTKSLKQNEWKESTDVCLSCSM